MMNSLIIKMSLFLGSVFVLSSFFIFARADESEGIMFLMLKPSKECVISELERDKHVYKNTGFDYKLIKLYPTNSKYEAKYTGDFEEVVQIYGKSDEWKLKAIVNTIRHKCYPEKASESYNLNPEITLQRIADINTKMPIYLKIHNGSVYKWEFE